MKAIVKDKPGPGFVLSEVPTPRAGSGTVVVQVKAVGICGTDIPIFEGVRPVPYPLIPGHEFAGVISEVGAGVEGWQVGERVAVGLVIGCGRCPYCRQGEESLCDDIREIGIHVNGAYAEYVQVPWSCLHHLPDDLSFIHGATVDALASSYRGLRRAAIGPEDRVVIFGPGAIGLYALQAIRAQGAKQVIVVGRGSQRLAVATALGADAAINIHQEDPVEAVARLTTGQMATVVVEATGNPEVLSAVVGTAAKGARVVLLGIFHHQTRFDPGPLVRRELRLEGSFCYNWADYEASLQLIQRGLVRPDAVVTHVLPLMEMGHALELLKQRQAIKIILEP